MVELKGLSVLGKSWKFKSFDNQYIHFLKQHYSLPDTTATILAVRQIEKEQIQNFIDPKIKSLLPDPFFLKGMEEAVTRTLYAITKREKILVYGDYDVDGATSSALLRRYFRDLNHTIKLHIPDRIEEGYGANATSLQKIKEDGVDLVIMVDCGTNAFEALAHAKKINLDVIVIDHHTAENQLPECVALINPHRLDQDSYNRPDLKYLCAAGVSFLFCVALNQRLRQHQFFKDLPEPSLIDYLDLVALGTVCDVMPLKGINRAFVKQGLAVMNRKKNIGIQALTDLIGGIDHFSPYHLGFMIGPRINAGGRVGKSYLGSDLLSTNDEGYAWEVSRQLNNFNIQRQEIEQEVLEQALENVEKNNLYKRGVILIGAEGWHPGVIGIVASRIKEKYSLPVCVVAFDQNGIGKGSGRSMPGIELGQAMHAAVHQGLLEKGGGHSMAVGFTVLHDKFDHLYDFLEHYTRPHLEKIDHTLYLDCPLSLSYINEELYSGLKLLEPFGSGYMAPRFGFMYCRAVFVDVVADRHIRIQLEDESGNKAKAMIFRAVGNSLHKKLIEYQKSKNLFHVAASVKFDIWKGRLNGTLMIEDIMEIT